MAGALALFAPPWHTVGWNTPGSPPVPIFRAHALAFHAAHNAGAHFALVSGDRRDAVLAKFNREHRTALHGQQYLYDHQHEPRFYPANPPGRTSHCLRSDGSPVYPTPAGGRIPPWMLGVDAVDDGKANDCAHLVAVLNELGIRAVRPYLSSSEAHHLVITRDFVSRARYVVIKQAAHHHSRRWLRAMLTANRKVAGR